MSDLYSYDPTVRQYRRAKDIENAEKAGAEPAVGTSSADIYASSDKARPADSESFFEQSKPRELRNFHVGKFFAWIALLLMLAGWIYLVYIYVYDK